MIQEQPSYVTLTDKNFQHEVIESPKPVLVDFWAPWCGPCQAMGPVIKELAEEFHSRAVVAKVDVDHHPEIAARYGIRSIPTLMIFQNGEMQDHMIGTMPKQALAQKLEEQLQPA